MTTPIYVSPVKPDCPEYTALDDLNLYLTVSAYPRKRA